MNIYTNTPYVYRIGWSMTGMNYVGVRYAKDCHPDDLFVTYFTSSAYVADYIKEHGMPDIIEVRKTFTTEDRVDRARLHEHKVLRRMKVTTRNDYLNKTDCIAFSVSIGIHHHSYDPTIYSWVNKITNETVSLDKYSFSNQYALPRHQVNSLINGQEKSFRGWYLITVDQTLRNKGLYHYRADTTIYTWVHKSTGNTETLTRLELMKKYDLHHGNLSLVIDGKRKSIGGWILIR
jgi:hypothetical protein